MEMQKERGNHLISFPGKYRLAVYMTGFIDEILLGGNTAEAFPNFADKVSQAFMCKPTNMESKRQLIGVW